MTPAQDATALADKFAHGDVNAVQFNLGPDRNFETRFWPTIGGARVRNADTPDDGYATHAEALVAGAQYRNDCRATLRATSQTPDACPSCGNNMGLEWARGRCSNSWHDLLSTPSASAGPQAEAVTDQTMAPDPCSDLSIGELLEWLSQPQYTNGMLDFDAVNHMHSACTLIERLIAHPQPQQAVHPSASAETAKLWPDPRQPDWPQQADGRGAVALEAAKRMQCLNATLQLKTACWNEVDENEKQHWISLATVALTAHPQPQQADGRATPSPRDAHKQIPVQVWADIDVGISDAVRYLNTIPGVRTHASCQGTIGEGGPAPYRAQVMATWQPECLELLQQHFDITPLGENWGYLHPRCELPSIQPADGRGAVIEALKAVLAYEKMKAQDNGWSDCTCMGYSRETESAYERGKCPHQTARAALQQSPATDGAGSSHTRPDREAGA